MAHANSTTFFKILDVVKDIMRVEEERRMRVRLIVVWGTEIISIVKFSQSIGNTISLFPTLMKIVLDNSFDLLVRETAHTMQLAIMRNDGNCSKWTNP